MAGIKLITTCTETEIEIAGEHVYLTIRSTESYEDTSRKVHLKGEKAMAFRQALYDLFHFLA